MYLTNAERIRLGLTQYGSDVPEDVVAAAEAALVGTCCPAPTAKAATRKRARTVKGQYQGDDQATPDVNEAFVDG